VCVVMCVVCVCVPFTPSLAPFATRTPPAARACHTVESHTAPVPHPPPSPSDHHPPSTSSLPPPGRTLTAIAGIALSTSQNLPGFFLAESLVAPPARS
jgi:hypothetical protein